MHQSAPRFAFLVVRAMALAAVVGLTVVSIRTAVAGEPAAEVKLPDTNPGKVARGFLDMINRGTPEATREFESAHASAKRRAGATIEERVGRVKDMRARWGELRVTSVIESSDRGITVMVDSSRGQTMQMEFKFDESDRSKLEGVMIESDAVKPSAISAEERTTMVESACRALEDGYVFPEVAKKMAEDARSKLKSGAYDTITTDAALAARLTEDFRAISHDKHLGLRAAAPQAAANHENEQDMLVRMAGDNFGFRKVELLPGNIGYIKFDLFVDHDDAKKTAASALAFVQHADALVFDLRSNGGGSPEMIRFITSYLFDTRTHLNDMVDREGKIVEEYWTLDDVPGTRFSPSVPVYVLTSARTFSGAEEFSYNLKNLKRATIIGETTGGGAHPVRGEPLSGRLMMRVPFMRAKNPISGTNWEGTGVAPDIAVPAEQALDRAIEEARRTTAGRKASK